MDLRDFEAALDALEDEFARDEWAFVKLTEELLDRLTPDQAFELMGPAVELVLRQPDSDRINESLSLLIALARHSETTETPQALTRRWLDLDAHVASRGDYLRRRCHELRRWFRAI